MTSAETLESYLLIFSGVFNKYFLVIIKYSLVPNPNPNPKPNGVRRGQLFLWWRQQTLTLTLTLTDSGMGGYFYDDVIREQFLLLTYFLGVFNKYSLVIIKYSK